MKELVIKTDNTVADSHTRAPFDLTKWGLANPWLEEGQADDRTPMNGAVADSGGTAAEQRSLARRTHQANFKKVVAGETRLTIAQSKVVNTINAEKFGEICDGVWSDRDAVLSDRGRLSGDAALVRAVFWRLCKAGVKSTGSADNYDAEPTTLDYQSVVSRMLQVSARPAFDGAPILNELVERFHRASNQF